MLSTVEEQFQSCEQQLVLMEMPVSTFSHFPYALPGYWTWPLHGSMYLPLLLSNEWEQEVALISARQLLRDQYLRTLSAQQLQMVSAQQQQQQQREREQQAAGRANSK